MKIPHESCNIPDHHHDHLTVFNGPIPIPSSSHSSMFSKATTPASILFLDKTRGFSKRAIAPLLSFKRVGSPDKSTSREGPISPNNKHSHKISCPDSKQDQCSTSVVNKPVTGCFEQRQPTGPKNVIKLPENERPSMEPPQSAL
ncbi:hypothetical protein PGTUg99_012853 [Puccinia graminis f. sp. tritici]|uniref:Uncharacterized protein n=1 Tax=Puccinia graminis f. sp. tritici TaxID=56615 RepID=A0A5B0NRE4_PUCGR|nr:hypothetical protein PGTUg99_012853 [Puccinia graminis f. sp. tritici]